MSRVKNRDTSVELALRVAVFALGLRYRVAPHGVLGRPDLVFARAKVAVFVDGDFWHGWRFTKWAGTLTPFWRAKIEKNITRDRRNRRRLRAAGWAVVRLWEHEVNEDVEACAVRVRDAVRARERGFGA